MSSKSFSSFVPSSKAGHCKNNINHISTTFTFIFKQVAIQTKCNIFCYAILQPLTIIKPIRKKLPHFLPKLSFRKFLILHP
uniref:Uncharacterized protein n=1 Tax=Solanum lycopersicum TaxID=4081 RepID=A0A3Q7GV00_SOLLC